MTVTSRGIMTGVFFRFFPRLAGRLAIFWLLLALPLAVPAARVEGTAPRAHVLVLMSYHHGHSWEDTILKGIDEWHGAGNAQRPVFHVEWMDSRRYPEAAQRQLFAAYLDEKYRGQRFDLVITVDNNALEFALQDSGLLAGTPIVFCGVNGDPVPIVGGRAGVTGVAERFELERTLRLARVLHEDAGRLLFLTAADETGAGTRETLRRALDAMQMELPVDHWVVDNLAQIAPRLQALPEKTLIFAFGSMPESTGGRTLGSEEVVAYLRARTALPLYSDLDRTVGYGAVGGYMNSGLETGRVTAGLAIRVLAGEAPAAIPYVYDAPLVLVFDYKELRRLGIPTRKLPEGSTLLNAPPSLFDPEYRGQLIAIATLVTLLLLTLIGLLLRSRMQAERQAALRYQATHDELTGLPNRRWLMEHLAARVPEGKSLALVMLDLNRFKLVNDTYGHSFGDELVAEVALRLKQWLLSDELLVRFSGDSFVIVTRCDSDAALEGVRERCGKMLVEPFLIKGRRIPVSAAFGMSIAPGGTDEHERLLREADTAMYEAKRSGRAQVVLFDSGIHERAVRQFQIEAALQLALERGEIGVHFQPIVDSDSGRIAGFEALARWTHADLGPIPPVEFIRAAIESGRIGQLTQLVLRAACRAFVPHLCAHGQPYLAVNVSVSDIYADEFSTRLVEILAAEGVPPDRLVLEVTEDMLLGDVHAVTHALARLRDQGVRIAIDDFGTGYASMGYLSNYMVNIIKIDRSFVRNILTNGSDQKIVRAVVSMAADLELAVVTEGVETAEQAALLRQLGCVLLQGYAYGRPRPPEEWAVDGRLEALSA